MRDKQKCIIIWSSILFIFVLTTILILIFGINSGSIALSIIAPIIVYTDIVILILWIASFFTKYKMIYFENFTIEIYAGIKNNYIKIDSEIKDEYKGLKFTPIQLNCKFENNYFEITISPSNFIKLKINNEFVK